MGRRSREGRQQLEEDLDGADREKVERMPQRIVTRIKGAGCCFCFFFQAEDGIRDIGVTGVQTCALPISFEVSSPAGGQYLVRLVESDPDAYDRFYNVVANPMLWFIQHYLWDLSNAPDIRRHEVDAYENGYCAVNADLARAVLEELEGTEDAVVMLHDYHLYVAPRLIRAERPDLFLHHFVHIPWTQPDAWRVLPADIREDIYEGILSNDIIAFHTRSYQRNFKIGRAS